MIYETGFVNKTMPFYITGTKKNELSNHLQPKKCYAAKKYFPEFIERTQNLYKTFF
jgi:hypothetical protein